MVVLAVLGARIQLALPTGFVTRLPTRLNKRRAGRSAKGSSVVFGAKGLGEAALLPTAAAIANAVEDAIGVRIKELPITPEKIIKALKEKA